MVAGSLMGISDDVHCLPPADSGTGHGPCWRPVQLWLCYYLADSASQGSNVPTQQEIGERQRLVSMPQTALFSLCHVESWLTNESV